MVKTSPSPTGLTAAERLAFALLWLFVCSFPMEKSVQIAGLGTLSKVLGMGALGAGVLAVAIDGRVRTLTRTHAVLGAFVLWTAITLRWSLDPEATITKAMTCLQLLAMVWLIWEFCGEERHVMSLMQAYVVGTLGACISALVRYETARQTYYQRYAADGFDPNDFALTLALSIPLSYALAMRSKGRRAVIYWLQLALVFVTILLSASRTGFLAACLAASIVPLTFAYTRQNQKRLLLAGVLAAMLSIAALVPATSWHRLATIGSEVESGSLNERSLIWNSGLETYRSHWLAGVGSGAFPRSVEPLLGWPSRWVIVAHNTLLSILVETGLCGFLLFASFLAMLVASVWRLAGVDRIAWLVTLAVWFIGVNTLTWETRKPTWFLFALALTHARFAEPYVVRFSRRLAPRDISQDSLRHAEIGA